MPVADTYLAAAEHAVVLLRKPEVAKAWEEPSALPEMTVGALAGHLAYQVLSVGAALSAPIPAGQAPIPLLDHYARATWVGTPLDDEANTGIRLRGADIGADGPQAVWESATAELAELRTALAGRPGDGQVHLPPTGWSLTLDDFLTTRLLEIAVHADDLAVSVGLPTQDLPEAAFDPALVLLTRLAARRHGQAALLRALARAERAPAAVNAL